MSEKESSQSDFFLARAASSMSNATGNDNMVTGGDLTLTTVSSLSTCVPLHACSARRVNRCSGIFVE